jgi:hypothetical protein
MRFERFGQRQSQNTVSNCAGLNYKGLRGKPMRLIFSVLKDI